MKFLEYLKPKLKNILGLSLLVAVVSLFVFPALDTKADGPQFNFLQGDYDMLRGRNVTANETVFKDPASGAAGDVFEGEIYYHNGVLNTVAANTVVKVTLPAETTGNTAVLLASISADNASAVTDTVVDGAVIGYSGLTVNLNQPATLSLVPGSVEWFPNVNSQGSDTPTPLPGGQSGDVITGAGVNLGDIQGCWDFAGFVRFKFQTTPIVSNLKLTKTVSKATNFDFNFGKTAEAKSGDYVIFKLDVANTGTTDLSNVVLKDTVPAGLTPVQGTFNSIVNSDFVLVGDGSIDALVGNGYDIGTLAAGATASYSFTAQVSVAATVNDQTLRNTATVTSGTLSQSDTADVVIKGVAVTIELHKGATNTTTGKQATSRQFENRTVLGVDANPGDEIVYSLSVVSHNVGTPQFVVSDGIADILEEADVTKISDSGKIVNGTTGNDAKLIQWPAIDLAIDQPLIFTFTVRVKNPLPNNPANGYSFDDRLYNKYGDEVIVFINRPVPKADLQISKSVRNFTANEPAFSKANEAFAGDTLEYKIDFKNTGTGSADSVKFVDVLPPNTLYLEGTTVVFDGNTEKTMIDGIATSNGVTVSTISSGKTGFIKFKAITSTKLADGETLVNTVNVMFGSVSLTDIAKTTIKVKPIVPQAPIAPMLPRTGSTAGGSFVLTFFMGIAGTYMKYRKLIGDELDIIKIANAIH